MIRRGLLVVLGWVLVASVTSGVAAAAAPPAVDEAAAKPTDPSPLESGTRDLARELDLPASQVGAPAGEVSDGGGRVAGEDERVREQVGLRSEGSETYLLESGLRQSEFFPEPRWYRTGKGDWAKVDPKVEADRQQSGTLSSTGAGWRAEFTSSGVSISFEGRTYALAVKGTNGEVRPELDATDDTAVWYRDVWPDVDVRYRVSATGLKEDFIVKSPEGFRAAGSFPVEVTSEGRLIADPHVPGGYLLDWDGDGKTAVDDASEGPRFELPPPVVADATGQFLGNDRVSLAVDPKDDDSVERRSRTIGVTVPADWVSGLRPEQFPVTVDPSTTIIPSSMGGSWASYNSAGNLAQGSNQWGLLGNWRIYSADDYWRYNIAPGYSYLWNSIAANARVFAANLKLDTVPYPTAVSPFTGSNYPTGSWGEGVTVCQANNWNYGGAYPGMGWLPEPVLPGVRLGLVPAVEPPVDELHRCHPSAAAVGREP